MSIRKSLYEFLETTEDGQGLLTEVKDMLKELDGHEGALRIANKENETLTATLANKDKEFVSSQAEVNTVQTELEKQVAQLVNESAKRDIRDKEREEQDKKTATQLAEANKLKVNASIHKELDGGAKTAFGGMAPFLLDSYISNGTLKVNADNKIELTADNVTYEGPEVLERLKVIHKESIVGEGGTSTQGGGGKPASTVDYNNVSSAGKIVQGMKRNK